MTREKAVLDVLQKEEEDIVCQMQDVLGMDYHGAHDYLCNTTVGDIPKHCHDQIVLVSEWDRVQNIRINISNLPK